MRTGAEVNTPAIGTTLTSGVYRAIVTNHEKTPHGVCTTWTIVREGPLGGIVGKMFEGTAGYGVRPFASMATLLWAGELPGDCFNPKSEHYGIHFDTGPGEARQIVLDDFAKRAERLTAWRCSRGLSERLEPWTEP